MTLTTKLLTIAAATAVGGALFADWWSCLPPDTTASYVGRQSCIQCHARQAELYRDSHHDRAMDRASPETVLGDFSGVELIHHGITSRMFRRDGKYLVNTEGPDGEMGEFEVRYVFGVEPLQQYMVEFDRPADMPEHEVARLQVLRISWDTVRQEWFYLSPPDVDEKLAPDDDLHWTGIAQRWNNMCADCHSTNLRKNFDLRTKTYHTTFSEIDVSCEACHGPGSVHVGLANARSLFWDRKVGYGLARLKDDDTRVEIHTCARCHSRRSMLSEDFRPGDNYYDHFSNELLQAHTYHADGQILDEVYVFGSYIQSKMYHQSIRCTDCHDPHTARLKESGNQVCTSCHQHSAGKYDHPTHHRHNPGSSGAQCVACHMPETTYMDVDPRRDHSLRVPRPDLSVRTGTPNACTGCHLERAPLADDRRAEFVEYAAWLEAARSGDEAVRDALAAADAWAAEAFDEWYGAKDDLESHFANAFAAARQNRPEARDALLEIAADNRQTPIVRATSLLKLGRFATPNIAEQTAPLLQDEDPQVRIAALQLMQLLPDSRLVLHAAPLLSDPRRSVRTEAGRILARVNREQLRGPQRLARKAALREFERGVRINNDRGAAHLTLGLLHESQRDLAGARAAYETAIEVEPATSGPRSNLAAVYEQSIELAVRRLRSGRAAAPNAYDEIAAWSKEADRLRREELVLLARDAQLAPEIAGIQYRYGLALYLNAELEKAEQALRKAVELEPRSPDYLLALVRFLQQCRQIPEAIRLAERLLQLQPENPGFAQLLAELRAGTAE